MAHPEQQRFCLGVKELFPSYFDGSQVLEIGSQNVNGTMRAEFEGCHYTGVDVVDGEGVDVVSKGHKFAGLANDYDVVFSCEVFEHDPYAQQTVLNMCRMLKPGGLFFMTCATTGRGEHGTTKTTPGEVWGPNPDFYRNVELGTFLNWIGPSEHGEIDGNYWIQVHSEINDGPKDLYFYGIKA